MIKQQIIASLEKNIADIKVAKDRECTIIKERVMREKIAPLNAELDKVQAEGIAELNKLEVEERQKLTEEFNKQLQASKEKYEADRKAIIDKYTQKKQDNISSILATATYEVEGESLKYISKFENMLKELKDKE